MQDRSGAARVFVAVGLVFAAAAAYSISVTDRYGLHVALNGAHAPALDLFFRYATHLADGLVPTGLAVLLLLISDRRSFLMMALSTGASALVVQFLKHQVFADHDRPIEHLARMPDLYLIPGVEMNHHFSFPSGHSTAAFSMCFALAVIVGRKGAAGGFAVLGAVLAYSRVYLSQHFTEDILAGATLGTVTAWLIYYWLYASPSGKRPWFDRRMFSGQK